MLDGAAKIDELLTKAVDFEMPAIAITDHGNNFGAYEFWQKATKKGIKPIIGIEAYLAPGSRLDKSRTYWADGGDDDLSKGAYSHLTMLSTDSDSMMNLFKLKQLFGVDMNETGLEGGEIPYSKFIEAVERVQMKTFWDSHRGKIVSQTKMGRMAKEELLSAKAK